MWQPIETMPLGVDVLLCDGKFMVVAERDEENPNKVWTIDGSYPKETYTHWMPLPELPQS